MENKQKKNTNKITMKHKNNIWKTKNGNVFESKCEICDNIIYPTSFKIKSKEKELNINNINEIILICKICNKNLENGDMVNFNCEDKNIQIKGLIIDINIK